MRQVDVSTGVLVSGGLDSCILLAHLLGQGGRIQPFYIRSGLAWESFEMEAVQRFLGAMPRTLTRQAELAPLVVLDLPLADVYGTHWSVTGSGVPDESSAAEAVYLPGRNALLVVKAAVWCQLNGVRRLALAPLGTSPFPDASSRFFEALELAVNCGAPRPLELVCPFGTLAKRQVMELGRDLPLDLTVSCLSPVAGAHCGWCNKCSERREAFRSIGLPDPTRYATELVASSA